jgi:GrpB-like predicted nucleotidyltransferase (UPF0157 family)
MPQLQLFEHQDTWSAQFLQVADTLRMAMAACGPAVEHIGSTSVPGLCAKPVLDILVGVSALSAVKAVIPSLVAAGFVYRPEYEQMIPGRRYFVRPAGPGCRVHLHAVVRGGRLWQQHLYFRDRLRQDTSLRQSYAALKTRLAAVHASDKAAYTEAKAPFIAQVLASCPHPATLDQRGAVS